MRSIICNGQGENNKNVVMVVIRKQQKCGCVGGGRKPKIEQINELRRKIKGSGVS